MTTPLYQHTQSGHLVLLAMAAIVAATLLLPPGAVHPAIRLALPLGGAALAGLFGWLTVTVDGSAVTARYGLGMIRRRFPLERIQAVRTVRNHWWYGFGMRLAPPGWMCDVRGLDAVELTLEGERKFRIGTDHPAELRDAIRRAVEAAGRRLTTGPEGVRTSREPFR
ncbi:MAG: PH domain-containing protein [Acidobacteriota bacterium]|nr:PH domain-containing protein [Acidobacteriota bacterium]MDQ7086541.1 PH domain-containing protein [Acidobacteriota bacterium]